MRPECSSLTPRCCDPLGSRQQPLQHGALAQKHKEQPSPRRSVLGEILSGSAGIDSRFRCVPIAGSQQPRMAVAVDLEMPRSAASPYTWLRSSLCCRRLAKWHASSSSETTCWSARRCGSVVVFGRRSRPLALQPALPAGVGPYWCGSAGLRYSTLGAVRRTLANTGNVQVVTGWQGRSLVQAFGRSQGHPM